MKKHILHSLLIFAIIATATYNAQAVGIGLYGTGGAAAMKYSSSSSDTSSTDYHYGGGLIIDTVAAKDQPLGYRFTAGYERYDFKISGVTGLEPIHRYSMTHTLSWGIERSAGVRLWLGPQLGLHYIHGRYSIQSPYLFLISTQVRLDYVGLDVLLALGMNVNIGDTVTLFIELGLGYMGNFNVNDTSEIGYAAGAQAKIGVMFRFDDTYSASQSRR